VPYVFDIFAVGDAIKISIHVVTCGGLMVSIFLVGTSYCGYHCGFDMYCGYQCGFDTCVMGALMFLICLLWGVP
jgi:hypothetical protein